MDVWLFEVVIVVDEVVCFEVVVGVGVGVVYVLF